MNLKEVDKPEVKKTIVVYSGRFQPFHRGHNVAYQKLVSKFGANNVYIGTSDKTDGGKSPFNFSEKKTIMQKMFGIPSNKIVQVSNPYAPKEILSKFDGKTTAYIAAVGEKDATRLAGKYFKPYNGKTGYGYDEIGYTYIIPAEKNPISGTDVRNGLGNADIEKSKSFFLKAYPKFDKDIFNMIKSKLNEEGLPGGIGVGLNLPNGYINGAPTGSMDELYDPINELLGRVAAEEIFNEWLESYLGEAPNPIMDKEITYNSADGKKKKITVRGALRLPKDHEAHIQAAKMVGPDDAPANEPKKKAETPPQPGQPVKKGDTAQGKADAKPKDGVAGAEKQAPPPEQKLSGAELKSDAEMTDADRHTQRVEKVLNNAKKGLSKEDNESIDKANSPESPERKGAVNVLKKAASYVGHGIQHVFEHNKEMLVGTASAIKSLAHDGRFGGVKDSKGRTRHWDDFTEPDPTTNKRDTFGVREPKMKDVPVYKEDKHGHPIKDENGNKIQAKNWLGKPKTKKEPVYREDLTPEERQLAEKSWKESQRQKSGLKTLAKTTGLIMGSIVAAGALMGGGAAAMAGAGPAGIAKAAGAKIAYKFGGGHLGSYVLKDIIKHSALEALGASAGQATAGGVVLGATGIFENKNAEEGFDTKKFVPKFIEKTLEIMENYKLSNEQLIQTLAEYKKEGTTNQSMANAKDLMKENLSETKQQSIQHFVEFATKRLKLKENPQINLVGGKEYGNVKSSLGGYNPIDKTIYVATEGRLTADILRTIAHEMVHRKQDELGLIKNEVKDGADGSPIENQAHAVAGILMREYGRINKQIYNEDVNVDVDKGDEVLMGKFKNKKVTVKDIGKDQHGMPTINGKQATTFRTVNEINKGFFKGKIKIGGQPVDVEVELVGADNKNREFVTKVIGIDKKYQSKLPIGSTLPIPARLFRHGGWVKVKTPSAFNERIDGDTYNADTEGEEDFTKHHATSMYAPDMGYGAEPDTYDFDDLKDTKPGYQTPSQDKDVEDRGYEPVKKNSKIDEVSNVNTANTADVPDGAFIKKGKKRTLDTDKSESWYENGGYTQTDFPKADAIFGDDDAEERTIKYTIKNLPNVQFTPTEFIKEENITEVAARYVEPKRVEAFLKKYPKVEDLMQKIVDKVKDVDRGYQIFLHYKNDKRQEQYFGGKKEGKSKSTNVKGLGRTALNKTGKSLNSSSTYYYEWDGKIDIPTWGEVFQHIWNKKYQSINESLLMEGGAYGHMNHPFDISMNLTFGDLKKIINNALDGKLGVVREKTDGQALAISWKNGKLIAARNKGHLVNGGANALDMNALASKFGGRGALSDAYNFAMRDLSAAISGLGEKERQSIFKDGSAFCNLEVIYPENANVIPYGQSLLIFHNVVEYDEKGNAVGAVKGAESKLASLIKQTNAHVQSKYTLQGPPITKLPKDEKLSSQKSKFNGMLSRLQSEFGLSDKDGVAEYHYAWWMNFINKSKKNLAQLEKEGLARRWAFDNKSFPIKSITDEDARKWADGVDKDAKDKIMKGNLRKFEDIFLGVGAEVLSFMSSVLTAQPDKALQSIKASLESSISDIRSGGSEAQIKRLEKELARLNAIGGFEKLVPNEGLVFFYKGNTYKLTGTFAPLNQILGIFKFGR